jgi:TolB-like protein
MTFINKGSLRFLIIGLCTVIYFSGCKTTNSHDERAMHKNGQAPKTLAIFPFENNSVTNPGRYAPLSKGLAAMLITDLNNNQSAIELIERNEIQVLLQEIALGQSGSVDESTAVDVGKILGAQSIAFGSFMVLGANVRMDVRIIKVETSELIVSESISGSSSDFMALETKLAGKIADSLRVAFIQPETEWKNNMDAALFFSQGLEAFDQGNTTEAKKLFQQSIELDPAFQAQVDNLEGLK